MSDNGFVRLDRLKTALSRVKTKVDSDIASAISESTISLTSVINLGDASTLSEAKGYADGLKIIIDSNISSGDSSTLTSANSYTDSKIFSVNSTINDLSESIPGQIDLALENYTEYSDFSDHISDTDNPHNVTYSQVGAAASSHTHTESDITDLGNYANSSHTHTVSDITDVSTELAAKSHTHTTSEITNFGNYANSSHTHVEADITDLGSYASSSHTHTLNDITDSNTLATNLNLTTHTSNTNNPHQVTKTQVGLSNVDNTSDLDKPISTAVQTALDNLEDRIDAVDEIGSSITLASLGGASATDLSNHISDTNNPHSVTYSQTGAAAASHTHTEADITDLGSYASSSHTHTLTNITDITATATEVNNVINSKKNIQTQINDCRFYGFFSEWEYEKEYHLEDVIKIPCCKPFQYLECIVEGTSGYIEKLTVTNSNNEDTEYLFIPYISQNLEKSSSTGTLTRTSLTLADLDMNLIPGETITDGSCVWLVQDIRDGRSIGEISYCTHSNANSSSPYIYKNYGLYPNDTITLYDGAYNCDIDRKSIYLKFIRLIKNSAISIDFTMDNIKTSNNNPARFFNLICGNIINLENGSFNVASYPILKRHFPGLIVILDWCFNPFTYLDSEHIDSIDSRVWSIINEDIHNSEYGLLIDYTRSQAIDEALILKSLINTGIAHDNNNSFYLNTSSLFDKFLFAGHYGKMFDPGLPNLKGTIEYITSKNMSSSIRTTKLNSTDAIKWLKNSNNYEVLSVTSGNSSNLGCWDIDLNASRYNSIYGNSTTVMPNSVGFHLLIKY